MSLLIKDVVAMELTDEVYNSVNSYFNTLSHTGYRPDIEVYKLIIFTFIEELLYGPLSQFITDEDYTTINSSLECLYGSCLMPYPNYKKSFDPVIRRMLNSYRVTESGVLRVTTDPKLRIES